MPIRLLKHKSWHVYSADNIERVRSDEARELSRIEAESELQQRVDDQARLDRLRHLGQDCEKQYERTSASSNKTHSSNGPVKGLREQFLPRGVSDSRVRKDHSVADPGDVERHRGRSLQQTSDKTFKNLSQRSWYEHTGEVPRVDPHKQQRIQASLTAQDPLSAMKTHLARNKAKRAERRSKHRRVEEDDHLLDDRYPVSLERSKRSTRPS